jgi:hypothetical protein
MAAAADRGADHRIVDAVDPRRLEPAGAQGGRGDRLAGRDRPGAVEREGVGALAMVQ